MMSKTMTLAKPTLANKSKSESALAFAEAGAEVKLAAEKRAFFAPEGYRRLPKKLRLAAIEQDCTATDIIERLLVKELS